MSDLDVFGDDQVEAKRLRNLWGGGCLLLILAVGGGLLASPFRCQRGMPYADTVVETWSSPDGAVTATLRNFETIAYGYEYITLERRNGGAEKVVEFVMEDESRGLTWSDSHTLIVNYHSNEGRKLEDIFVTRPDRWRDIKITYVIAP